MPFPWLARIEPGGKVLLAGAKSIHRGRGGEFALMKLTSDGKRDKGFGRRGIVVTAACTVTLTNNDTVTAAFHASPTPAPQTTIQKATVNSRLRTATFKFSAAGETTSFECRLTRQSPGLGDWSPCRSPATYRHLRLGRHTFSVRALGPGGRDSTPAKERFRIGPNPQG
jgi:hypothetical protein